MNAELAKVKPIAGLFLEGLMLVFIFVCIHADFSNGKIIEEEFPIHDLTSLHQVAFRSNVASETLHQLIAKHLLTYTQLTLPAVDFQKLKLTLSNALTISPFERNNFYVLLRDSAP